MKTTVIETMISTEGETLNIGHETNRNFRDRGFKQQKTCKSEKFQSK